LFNHKYLLPFSLEPAVDKVVVDTFLGSPVREVVEILDYRGSKHHIWKMHYGVAIVLAVEFFALIIHKREVYLLRYLVEKVIRGDEVSIYLF